MTATIDRAWHFAYGDGGDPATGQALALIAIAETLQMLVPLVREIGDQLDTIPRARRGGNPHRFPLHDAAKLLEAYAIGDEGSAREETLARLVMHRRWPYREAEKIALEALAEAGEDRRDEVLAAIKTLRIEVPA